jgi:hypothetical protein
MLRHHALLIALLLFQPLLTTQHFHAVPLFMNSSLASANFSATMSHRSIKSSKPFSRASKAVVPSVPHISFWFCILLAITVGVAQTICLNPYIHFRFRWVGDRVTTEFNIRTMNNSNQFLSSSGMWRLLNRWLFSEIWPSTHFFIMIYRKAFPRVWSSFKNSKDAAVSEDPGNW